MLHAPGSGSFEKEGTRRDQSAEEECKVDQGEHRSRQDPHTLSTHHNIHPFDIYTPSQPTIKHAF